MSASLLCVTGTYKGQSFPIDSKGLVIGREPSSANIILGSPWVSRSHTGVCLSSDGRVFIRDYGSMNGTHLINKGGKKKITGNEFVSDGQRFSVGAGDEYIFEVRCSAAAPRQNAADAQNPASLVCVAGACKGQSFPIDAKGLVIGREPSSASVILESPSVSRSHTGVYPSADGRIFVRDFGSTNGTHLISGEEKRKIAGDEFVSDGQRFSVGDEYVFEVRYASAAPRQDTAKSPKFAGEAWATPRPQQGTSNAVVFGIVGFLAGIPLSYFFQSPLVRIKMPFVDYLKLIPAILLGSGGTPKGAAPEVQAMGTALVGGLVAVIVATCVLCAALAAMAGYYVDQSRKKSN
ncbi:MAG: FHA domain-containing protein [Synergistaceae bacterium]|jgi:pSer/pThr/pTyr-binding forkhead associated (FHA) protein|nr:FHA domain-containing protein [Synergistaceae bacterium]